MEIADAPEWLLKKITDKKQNGEKFKLPENIPNRRLLMINSSDGLMNYGDHYLITNDGWYVIINVTNVTLTEDQVLELYVYREVAGNIT